MPEGPELHLSSRFVNKCCQGKVFTGKIIKSEVHKSEEVKFQSDAYIISATSRGKEVQLSLTSVEDDDKKFAKRSVPDPQSHTTILFRFGMSGKFEFTSESDVHKHSHLKFFTKSKPRMVLSYVDVRRFGRFEETAKWGKDRGPDPMFEYQQFRLKVLRNLSSSEFDHPICEVLLNQKYFNGIGNYLRAEILYRLGIPPFEQARKVLEGLSEEPPDVKPKVKGKMSPKEVSQAADILHLCHSVPLEVVNLGGGGYDPEGNKTDYNAFIEWLQCYYQEGMKNMLDHNKRTIWFSGSAGPLIPKDAKSQKPTKRKNATKQKESKTKVKSAKKLKANGEEMSTPLAKQKANRVKEKTPSSTDSHKENNIMKHEKGTIKKSRHTRKAKSKRKSVEPAKTKKSSHLSDGNLRRSSRLKKS